MKGEFYKMEFDAWDEGTVELTLEEEAAYLRLCHQMYRRRAPVPNSDRLLCSLWRCHPNKARPLLQRLIEKKKVFLTVEGHIANTRVTQELDTRETLATQRADAGHKGGIRSGHARRKSLKNKHASEANGAEASSKRSREEKIREERVLDDRKSDASDFEAFWKAYPSRGSGGNPKAPAKTAFEKAVKSGADPAAIVAAAKRLVGVDRSKVGTPYVPQATTWLNQRRWEDDAPLLTEGGFRPWQEAIG